MKETPHMTDTIEPQPFTLLKPVTFEGVEYKDLTLDEPEFGAILDCADEKMTDKDRTTILMASIAGIPIGAMKKVKFSDFTRMEKAAEPIMAFVDTFVEKPKAQASKAPSSSPEEPTQAS